MLQEKIKNLQRRIAKLEEKCRSAEKRLIESRNIYRSITEDIFDSSKDGIIIIDGSFHIAWVNRSWLNYFGFEKHEIEEKKITTILREKLQCLFENSAEYAAKICSIYKHNDHTEHFECHLIGDDTRKERWFEYYSSPIQEGVYTGGRVEHYTDITRQKESESSLQLAKEYLETLINSSMDMIISVDKKRCIVEFNKEAQKSFGYTKKEVLGKHIEMLYANPEEEQQVCGATLQSGHIEREITNKKKSGELFKVVLSTCLLYNEKGEPTGTMGVSRDITTLQRMEKELLKAQKLESLGVLAGGIAHDFNNFLTSIVGNISLVRNKLQDKNSDDLVEMLDFAEQASDKAQSLTKQLLIFSKGGSPIKKPAAIKPILFGAIEFALHGSSITKKININDDLWTVFIDKDQIEQVLHNILINAIQVMPKRGEIEAGAENSSFEAIQHLPLKKDRYIKISISDHGPGISKENLQRIFDPFYTTKKNGNGLGLAIAYSIILKHDGHITATSHSGMGTTFSIYLPACDQQVAPPLKKQTKSAVISRKKQARILVMDDEEQIIVLLSKMLGMMGYEAYSAKNGEEAIALYMEFQEKGKAFDLVLLDLTIAGGMGGEEVIQWIRQRDHKIKAIVSSGYSTNPIMSNYKAYGFNGVVAKPYSFDILVNTIQEILG